uniref:ATP synthase complex subunit 8 n=1 Tax=Xenogryllus marmoratus TaxID=323499 RepID=A0A7L9QD13_9ORTH|nr:ATP synthase F0 subunit 8 [Xenogryllus marmoratus]
MPQMAPMWWEMLFLFFLSTFFLLTTLIYFSTMKKTPNKMKYNYIKKELNWSW